MIALVVAIAVYTGVYGWILTQRFWAFQTYAWDLGNYNQGMFTAAFDHRLFYYTADLPSGNIGSLLAAHFSPVLFLLLPFYALAPNPGGLLVIQTVALGLGALPLYLLARRTGLPNSWSLLLSSSYLLSPVLMGVGWYDFHPEALLPMTVLWAIYGYYYGSRWTFVVAWILALAVIETVSALLFLFAAGGLIALVWSWLRKRSPSPSWRRTVVAAAVPPVWLGFAVLFTQVVNHGGLGAVGTGYSNAYSILGPNLSFVSVVPYAITHPSAASAALSFGAGDKVAYILVLFGSVAFLPALGPKRLLLPVVGWAALAVLSNGSSLYQFGDQYAAYPLPFLSAGAVFGLARLRAYWRADGASRRSLGASPDPKRLWPRFRRASPPALTASVVVLAVICSSGLISPLLSNPSWNYSSVAHGLPTVTAHDRALHDVLGLIPPSASVLTVSPVFPEVSSRANAFVVPISSSFSAGRTFGGALGGYVNSSRFVLVDYTLDFFSSAVLARFANLSGFGLLAEEDGIALFQRGWTGPPQIWVPVDLRWAGGQLATTAYSYVDWGNSTAYGPALSSVSGAPKGALVWTGPYVYGLPPGEYSVTFWTSVTSLAEGPLIRYDSVADPVQIQLSQEGPISGAHTYSFGFSTGSPTIANHTFIENPTPAPYSNSTNLSVSFRWPALSVWSVAGWIYAASTQTHLFAVTLTQLTP